MNQIIHTLIYNRFGNNTGKKQKQWLIKKQKLM